MTQKELEALYPASAAKGFMRGSDALTPEEKAANEARAKEDKELQDKLAKVYPSSQRSNVGYTASVASGYMNPDDGGSAA